jgi:hypothetical protein
MRRTRPTLAAIRRMTTPVSELSAQ